MKKIVKTIYVLNYLGVLMCFNLSACTSATIAPIESNGVLIESENVFPDLDASLFKPTLEIEQKQEILRLSDSQLEDFNTYFNSVKNKTFKAHEKVYRYLQALSDSFTYKNSTFIASETLDELKGNCMSLAVLTAALTKVADVRIEYQLVNRIPIYQEYGDIVFKANHIKTALFEPVMEVATGVQLYRNYVVVDYYPSRFSYVDGIVSEDEFFAMYYRNRSSEELGLGNFNKSYYYLIESLEYEPKNEEAINNLAILHRRVGDEQKAEELYLYGIEIAKNKLTLLRNYKAMLALQGRTDKLAEIQARLDKYDDENPFEWIRAGNEAFTEQDYVTARRFYAKAIEKAPYLHQAHFGIAKVEYMLGNPRATKKALNKAVEQSFDARSKAVYEAKLEALGREHFN